MRGRGGLVWFEFSDAAHVGKTCVGVYRRRRAWKEKLPGKCRIPDGCIDPKRYPLFMARAVLQELIESLQSTLEVKPC